MPGWWARGAPKSWFDGMHGAHPRVGCWAPSLAGALDLVAADEAEFGTIRANPGRRTAGQCPYAFRSDLWCGVAAELVHCTADDVISRGIRSYVYEGVKIEGGVSPSSRSPCVGHFEVIDPKGHAWGVARQWVEQRLASETNSEAAHAGEGQSPTMLRRHSSCRDVLRVSPGMASGRRDRDLTRLQTWQD